MKLKIYFSRAYLFIVHIIKIDFVVNSKILQIKKKLLKKIAPDKKKKSHLFLIH